MEEEYDDSYELGEADAFSNVAAGLNGRNKAAMVAYWQQAIDSIERIGEDGSEVDSFKSTALPLARIKKVMKTDADVCMISAEAPILFAKGCDIFITELTMRAWIHAEESKRRTLQRSDIANALQKSDMFDFLIDIVPREEAQPRRFAPPAETGQPPQGSAPGIQGPLPGIQGPSIPVQGPSDGQGVPGIPGAHEMNPPHQNVPQNVAQISQNAAQPHMPHAGHSHAAHAPHPAHAHPAQGLAKDSPTSTGPKTHNGQPESHAGTPKTTQLEEPGEMFIGQSEFRGDQGVKMEPPFEEFSYTTYPEHGSTSYNDENGTFNDGEYRDF